MTKKRKKEKIYKVYSDIFHKDEENLTFRIQVPLVLEIINENHVYTRSYRYPFIGKEEIQMLEYGVILSSQSPWGSPIWIDPKNVSEKPNGELVMIIIKSKRKL